jgi:putative DNA primase/helicase
MNAPSPNKFAIKAASAVSGKLAIPEFGATRTPNQTDFNDLAQSQGPEAVSRSINSAQFVIPESSNVGEKTAPNHESKINLIRGSDLTPKPVDWLWPGWMAAGKFHILGGAPGTGKTTISIALAATVTVGGTWPDCTKAEQGNVIIWTGEDDPADTLVPRVIAAGGDPSRVYFIGGVSAGGHHRPFDPATDIGALQQTIAELGNVRLVIVDPVVSAVAGDGNKNNDVRRGLQPLVDLAASENCAVLGITHFSKGTAGRNPIERVTGSVAFGAVARVVMVAAKHQESTDQNKSSRIFCRAKSNIGPDDGGFEYELSQTELKTHPGLNATYIRWVAKLEGEARDLLAAADAVQSDGDGGTLGDAKRFLTSLLEDGPMPVKEIQANARGAGYSEATIRRAKDALKVEAIKIGKDRWEWQLPISAPPLGTQGKVLNKSEDAHQKSVSAFDNLEHLQTPTGGYSIEI